MRIFGPWLAAASSTWVWAWRVSREVDSFICFYSLSIFLQGLMKTLKVQERVLAWPEDGLGRDLIRPLGVDENQ